MLLAGLKRREKTNTAQWTGNTISLNCERNMTLSSNPCFIFYTKRYKKLNYLSKGWTNLYLYVVDLAKLLNIFKKIIFFFFLIFLLKSSKDHKRLPRSHINACWGVKLFLPKDFLKFCKKLSCQDLSLDCCHNLSFVQIWFFEVCQK